MLSTILTATARVCPGRFPRPLLQLLNELRQHDMANDNRDVLFLKPSVILPLWLEGALV